MKIISIETKIYKIRNDDYENLKYATFNLSSDIVNKRLDDIEKNYKPFLILDDSYNFN